MTSKTVAHTLIKNEGRFIWYSLKSVLPFVDEVMVWDTGSTDHTVEIVSAIGRSALGRKKIKFRQLKSVTPHTFTKVSQEMIEQTPSKFTWIMILDGDEIWPKKSIEKVTNFAHKNPNYESIVVRTNNLVGDIYHRLPQSAGQYRLVGEKGHLALRFMNRKTIPGLHFSRPHGQRGLFDKHNTLIQDRNPKKIKFVNVAYHHATHLPRTINRGDDLKVPKRSFKLKYELGQKIPNNQIPEIFFESHPGIVPNVTQKRNPRFFLKALVYTPLKFIKRILIPSRSGY